MDRLQTTTRRAHFKKYEHEAKEVCAELNEYLMAEFGCKTPPAYVGPSNNINVNSGEPFVLYLRHKPIQEAGWGESALVIAQIVFDKQRVGNGTSLLRFLVRISDKYGYETIGIEEASNEMIVGFAKKYGFEKYRRKADWIASVENLKRFFGFAQAIA